MAAARGLDQKSNQTGQDAYGPDAVVEEVDKSGIQSDLQDGVENRLEECDADPTVTSTTVQSAVDRFSFFAQQVCIDPTVEVDTECRERVFEESEQSYLPMREIDDVETKARVLAADLPLWQAFWIIKAMEKRYKNFTLSDRDDPCSRLYAPKS